MVPWNTISNLFCRSALLRTMAGVMISISNFRNLSFIIAFLNHGGRREEAGIIIIVQSSLLLLHSNLQRNVVKLNAGVQYVVLACLGFQLYKLLPN